MYYHGQPVVGISQFFLSTRIRRGRDHGHIAIFNFECSLQPVRNRLQVIGAEPLCSHSPADSFARYPGCPKISSARDS